MTCTSCTQSRPDADQIRRARAIACQFCFWAEHEPRDGWMPVAVTCSASGKPVADHIQSCQPSCPRRKHPGADGIVRWGWVRWYGVPKFLRWLVAGQLTGPVPGCGCHFWLKNTWLRLTGRTINGGS